MGFIKLMRFRAMKRPPLSNGGLKGFKVVARIVMAVGAGYNGHKSTKCKLHNSYFMYLYKDSTYILPKKKDCKI